MPPTGQSRLQIVISAVTAQAERTLSSLSARFNGLKSAATSVGTSILKSFGGAFLVGGVAAITGTVLALTKSFTAAADKARILQTEFTRALGGNGALASKTIAQLKDLAPIDAAAGLAAGKRLINLGVSPDQTVAVLRQLRDLAEGNTETFSYLSEVMAEAFSEGEIGGRELKSLAQSGIPIIQELGRMFNKTGAEIKDMAGRGEIGIGDLLQAIANLTSENGKFHNGAGARLNSLSGQWEVLTTNIKRWGSEAADSWLPWLTSAARRINEMDKSGVALEKLATQEGVTTGYGYNKDANPVSNAFYRGISNLTDNAGEWFGVTNMSQRVADLGELRLQDLLRNRIELRMDLTDADKAMLAARRQARSDHPDITAPEAARRDQARTASDYAANLASATAAITANAAAEAELNKQTERNIYINQQLAKIRDRMGLSPAAKFTPQQDAAIRTAAGSAWDKIKLAEDVRSLDLQLAKQRLFTQEKQREAYIQDGINKRRDQLKHDLSPEQTAQARTQYGALYDAAEAKNIADANRELDRQIKYQELINQGREREAAILAERDRRRDLLGRDLTPAEIADIESKSGKLFDLRDQVRPRIDFRVDELTRVGGYNFKVPTPASSVPSADVERNRLLGTIVKNTAAMADQKPTRL